jgi:adenosine 3'-phospho 5'-phosphosulfate transporter B2
MQIFEIFFLYFVNIDFIFKFSLCWCFVEQFCRHVVSIRGAEIDFFSDANARQVWQNLSCSLGAKKYGRQDYIEGLFLTIGCLIFLLTGDTKAPQKAKDDSFIGLSLMALYLFSDGFTSTLQEKLFKGFTMSTYNQMIYVNGSSALLSIIALVSSGGLWTAIDFVFKYPPLFFDALVLSLCAMFGQQIIYYIIKDFGALFFATAMTTRQFVGILLSCMLFAHPLTIGQVGGTLVVAGAMYYKVFNKPPSHHGPKSAPEPSLVDKIQQAVGPAKSSGNEQGEKHSSRV